MESVRLCGQFDITAMGGYIVPKGKELDRQGLTKRSLKAPKADHPPPDSPGNGARTGYPGG